MFAATVVLTLAVAIGATTTAFALVDAVFLTRLPVRDQDRLVVMWSLKPDISQFPRWPIPWDIRPIMLQQSNALTAIAIYGFNAPAPAGARYGSRTVQLSVTPVSGNFFDVLGVQPRLGRLLHADDDVAGAPAVVVIGDRAWHQQFGADPHVVGRLLLVDGLLRRVIGVGPPEFGFPAGTDAWFPAVREMYAINGSTNMDGFGAYFVGRSSPGHTEAEARTALTAALRSYQPTPHVIQDWGDLPKSGLAGAYTDDVLGHEVRPSVVTLFAAAALVLIIACTNVAGLLIARGLVAARGLAVRAALGASRTQLIVHGLTESVLLGAGGGLVGLGLAAALIRGAVTWAPRQLPMIATARLNAGVLVFAGTVVIAVAIACGLWPAVRETRGQPYDLLRSGVRSVGAGPAAGVFRRALVAAQVALTLVVLSGAGLLSHSAATLEHVALGYDPRHLVFFRTDFVGPLSAAPRDSAWLTFWNTFPDRLEERLRGALGSGALGYTIRLPLSGGPQEGVVSVALDTRAGERDPWQQAYYDDVLDDYFGIVGVRIQRGRGFTRRDDRHGQLVVVVSESFARIAWPGQDPNGHPHPWRGQINSGADEPSRDPWYTVVGVVPDIRYDDLMGPAHPTVYTSFRQTLHQGWFIWRTPGSPSRVSGAIAAAVAATDPNLAVSELTTGASVVADRLARIRALTALFAGLAGTALFLAALGLFGVLATYVRERRGELAVRSALGATPARLRSLVIAQMLGVAAAGVACGIPFALGGSALLSRLVTDVQPPNVATVITVAVVLLVVVAVATIGPMVRASRVDARTALAAE
jgi:putative ABC transport system permease protein